MAHFCVSVAGFRHTFVQLGEEYLPILYYHHPNVVILKYFKLFYGKIEPNFHNYA